MAAQFKDGRVLSGKNATAISEAMQRLLAVLENAGINLDDVLPEDGMGENADNSKMITLYEQDEVNYTAVSTTSGEACANCRWYGGYFCHLVNDDGPEPIMPTGWCDKHEPFPQDEPEDPVVEAIENLATAVASTPAPTIIVEPPHSDDDSSGWYLAASEDDTEDDDETTDEEATSDEEEKAVYAAPTLGLVKRAQTLRSPLKPGTTVVKGLDGQRLMFLITSNGYKDREDEHVATKALTKYVDGCWTKDNTAFIGANDHYFWHVKDFGSISDLMYADVWDGFLIEVWREKPTRWAKSAYNFVEAHPELAWGASHGFFASKGKDNTFHEIHKFETTTLPLDAAANLATLSEVLPVATKSKRDAILQQLFDEQYGKGVITPEDLKQGTAHVAKKLQGLEVKGMPDTHPAVKEAQSKALANVAGLVLEMAETQGDFDQRVETTEKSVKEIGDKVESEVAKALKAIEVLTKQVESLTKRVNAGPRRPEQSTSTIVDEPTAAKVKQQLDEVEKKYNSLWGDMNVPAKKESS